MEFGFIHDKLDIKILILFILRRLPVGIDRDRLAQLTLCDGGITYFDFAECLGELIETQHVSTNGVLYELTEKGRRNGEYAEKSLPYSVRLKAERAASTMAAELQRSEMIHASHTLRRNGGYHVHLRLDDDAGTLLDLTLYVPTEEQALAIEKNFRENAEMSYGEITEKLL